MIDLIRFINGPRLRDISSGVYGKAVAGGYGIGKDSGDA